MAVARSQFLLIDALLIDALLIDGSDRGGGAILLVELLGSFHPQPFPQSMGKGN